jgi:hypothetical protein
MTKSGFFRLNDFWAAGVPSAALQNQIAEMSEPIAF